MTLQPRFDFPHKFPECECNRTLTGVATRLVLVSLIAFLLIAVQPTVGIADETSEVASGIIVEEAVLEPAQKGENSRLRFKMTNLSTQVVTLQGIHVLFASSVEVAMKFDEHGFRPVKDLAVLPEETLNLRSSHIKVEVVDLQKDLQRNSVVEFTIVFNDFETTAVADVH